MTDTTYELKVDLHGHDSNMRESLRVALRNSGFLQFVESCPDYKEHNPSYATESELVPQDMSRLSVYSFSKDELEGAKAVAESVAGFSCEISQMDTTVWQEGWKESFQPLFAGRFYVQAPWHKAEVPDRSVSICIDPGMAFGTGQHATTHVCLQLLSELAAADLEKPILDCGSGSGILSVAVRKLGGQKIVATDIEADAMLAIAENCKRNNVEGVELSRESVPKGSYGLIMANILTPVLLELLPQFVEALEPGGKILFSGVLYEQKDDFAKETKKHGLSILNAVTREGWLGLLMEKV